MYPYIDLGFRQIPSYGLMMAIAVLLCGFLGCYRAYRAKQRWEDALVVMACAFGCAIAGAAILYMLVTYSLAELWTIITTFQMPEGQTIGLVFLGGLLGAVPGVFLGGLLVRCNLRQLVLPLVPIIPLGHALGRVGCFLAGCCYGKPTDLPIGVVYTRSLTGVPTGVPLLPVQLMEATALLVIFALLLFLSYRKCTDLTVVGAYALTYAICRFSLETLRYDSIRGIYFGLSTSQWISLGLVISGVLLLTPAALRMIRRFRKV